MLVISLTVPLRDDIIDFFSPSLFFETGSWYKVEAGLEFT